MSIIADKLNDIGVTTYGNTARSDLDFSNARFLVKGSGFSAPGLNGSSRVIKKTESGIDTIICPATRDENDPEYKQCINCTLCKEKNNINIIYLKH
jgi:hypothetical protein